MKDRELYDKIMDQLVASSQNSQPRTRADTQLMDAQCDSIAEDMWKSYQEYLA